LELAWNYDVLVDIYRIAKGFINLFATLKNDAVSDGKIWGGGRTKKVKISPLFDVAFPGLFA